MVHAPALRCLRKKCMLDCSPNVPTYMSKKKHLSRVCPITDCGLEMRTCCKRWSLVRSDPPSQVVWHTCQESPTGTDPKDLAKRQCNPLQRTYQNNVATCNRQTFDVHPLATHNRSRGGNEHCETFLSLPFRNTQFKGTRDQTVAGAKWQTCHTWDLHIS